ncbi:hypothetical protein [Ruania zhangjianzhongii]|uniref:hypothetical protein n=1 Tax=Ruania zhangjianzhongii TaxID=2603206 RepID=UPI001F37A077|nr:hypothetical protein [Ruania zhangjianzhongii]
MTTADRPDLAQEAPPRPGRPSVVQVLLALRSWTGKQIAIAAIASVAIALLMGVATVLIPNSVFTRDIPPVWWNYPVWLLTSLLAGLLLATYVRTDQQTEQRSGRFGVAGAVLGWFAVGCPVCNKIALIALGYTGALTWFAPLQPVLALGALLLTGLGLYWRLRGQVACPLPAGDVQVAR